MRINDIVNTTYEQGELDVVGLGTFKVREVKHKRQIMGKTTKPHKTIVFKLDSKLKRYEINK